MKKSIKIRIRIKKCDKEFIDGEDPGVIAYQIIDYNSPEKDYESPMFMKELMEQGEEFLHKIVAIESMDLGNENEEEEEKNKNKK